MDSDTRDIQAVVTAAAARAARRRTGVVVGGLVPDGRTAYAGAGLERDGGSVPDQHTLFEIGSVTKVFTALVLADEVVRGGLDLEQPVRDLLPGVDVPTRDGREITLLHLATHTSGLPRIPLSGLRPWVEFSRGRDPYVRVTPDALLRTLERTRLERTPGTGKVAYSNFGFGLLGEALVRHTGAADYHDLVTKRVCGPLGLDETFGRVPADRAGDVAQGHRSRGRTADRWLLTGIAGAGVIVSSASDLLRFLTAQLDPVSTPLAEAIGLTHQERIGGRSGVGLGWMRAPGPSGPLVWHNGGTGGFRSFAAFDPGHRWAAVVLTNRNRGVDLTGLRLLKDLDPATQALPEGA